MKYGIIFSQNKELMKKYLKKKQENEDLKKQVAELQQRLNMQESHSKEGLTTRMNSTIHKRETSSPIGRRIMPTSYSTSSIFSNFNPADLEALDKYVENLKNSHDEEPTTDLRHSTPTPKAKNLENDTTQDKLGTDIKNILNMDTADDSSVNNKVSMPNKKLQNLTLKLCFTIDDCR